MIEVDEDLVKALRRARRSAEAHMRGFERDGTNWREETISELVWRKARPYVCYADFTHTEEKQTGADWLWWWLDSSGECFGMLTQAKRLRRECNRWKIDFWASKGEQMARLLEAADLLAVPAIYMLYLGSGAYRRGLSCGPEHHDRCARCRRMTVSVLTALQAQQMRVPRYVVEEALRGAIPVEDLAAEPSRPIHPPALDWRTYDPELRRFFLQGQSGARGIAQAITAKVVEARLVHFSTAISRPVPAAGGHPLLFPELPDDRGTSPRRTFRTCCADCARRRRFTSLTS